MTEMGEQLVVDHSYRGFPGIALGGFVGGLLAGMLTGSVEVSLRGPVPIGQGLDVDRPEPGRVILSHAGAVRAEARSAELRIDIPAPVSLAEGKAASSSYPGFTAHPFPGCFTCGPGREPGDGPRIFPGPVAGRGLVAAPWTPEARLANPAGAVLPQFVWAALDCPQLWALIASAPADSPERVVTATMTVRVQSPLLAGTPYVIVAWPMQRSGRGIFAGGAICSAHGEPMVAALQRAVAVPGRGVPLGRQILAA